MKKKVLSVLLLLALCLMMALPVFAKTLVIDLTVLDQANLLTQTEKSDLVANLRQISQTYGAQVVIITLPSSEGADVEDLIEDIFDSYDLGYGQRHDGILLLVCMDPREFCILTNGAANDAIGDWEIEKICDAMVSDMSDGNYYDAFETFIVRCDYYLDGHINGFPFDWGKSLAIALVIGLVAGLITAFCLKAQLKSVRGQHQADAYVKQGSMQLTDRRDLFLYRHITRTKKESNNNSSRSGGGSSRSVGGRSF